MYKEIVTKAVIGKGKKYFKNTYDITPEIAPTTILGCWVINHKFKGYPKGEEVGVDGTYDVNIWYSYDNDSKTTVINKTVNYSEMFNIKSDVTNDNDIIVRVLKQPSCSKVDIKDGKVTFDIEKELGVEIVGDTKVKIAVESDEEPWDVLNDAETTNDIDNEVKEEYL